MVSYDNDAKELATISLTDDQQAKISEATGVRLTEISVLKHVGEGARGVNPALIAATMVVACW